MKTEYPRYKQGELLDVEKKLDKEDKKLLDEFLKKCSITAGDKKVQKIKRLILQLFDVTETPLRKQTKESVNSFLVVLSKCDKSYWTKDEIRVYVKQFLMWHYKDLELVENFKSEARRELNPQKITENNLVTEEDIEKMLRFAQGYKDKCYLLLSFQTGARPQELAELTWSGVKFEDTYADVTLYSKKTRKSRTFPVVEETMNALWEWKQHYTYPNVSSKDYVFVGVRRGQPITTAGLNKMLRRMSKSAGLKKDVWNYLLRHTRATKLYEELPQQIVEKLMGHKNMAGIYAHISNKKAREVMLNKIYKIEQLSKSEREEMQQMKKDIESLKKSDKLMAERILAFAEALKKKGKIDKKTIMELKS
ncbi:MAG: tyrosine-type recombinase/integrase [archaeon]